MPVEALRLETAPIILRPTNILDTIVIRDLILDGAGDVAIDIEYPSALSSIWPTVMLQNVTVRGRWRTAFRLHNCWNATLIDCYAAWHAQDGGELEHPTEAVYGFDVGNSMDVQLVRPRVNGYQTAVRVRDLDLDGHGEGFHLHGGWLMNVDFGVKAEGFGSGGWPTPHLCIDGAPHIAANVVGIDVRKYFDVKICNVNSYGTHWSSYPLGVYLEDCRTVTLRDNTFWQNKNRLDGVAIAMNRVHQGHVEGSTVEPSWTAAYVIGPECRKVRFGANDWNGLPEYDLQPA